MKINDENMFPTTQKGISVILERVLSNIFLGGKPPVPQLSLGEVYASCVKSASVLMTYIWKAVGLQHLKKLNSFGSNI